MIQQNSKLKSSGRESREGNFISIPALQDQSSDRIPTPPPSPEKVQHDLFWRETVLFWNHNNYRKVLIEYIPCLLGLLWEEDKVGRIENLTSFPMESQYYFFKGIDVKDLSLSNLNYHRIFRTKLGATSDRRRSEPSLFNNIPADPHGISQESYLFSRFLKNVIRTTKISCTVLILSLKFVQVFLHKIRSINLPYCAGLESNRFRLFVTSLLLADKYSEDHPYTNKSWSSLSGLLIEDINSMERAFLVVMQHDMYVSENEFREWTKSIQNLCRLETPNPHHPSNSRCNFDSQTRRVSTSHINEIVRFESDSNTSGSNNSFSKVDHKEKTSFWSHLFNRK